MIDIPKEIQTILESQPQTESRWVKSILTRMRVFNTQIFDNVYDGLTPDNAEMVYKYMNKNFLHLNSLAYFDDDIDAADYIEWIRKFELNIIELEYKRFKLNEIEK
ncbi:MAG: hypothetical protein KAI81_04420 [Candidatus Marinimicrobia bacterium]|nr:hypothetical protein [Candidatus Neomarinimicrobiota bacterium]